MTEAPKARPPSQQSADSLADLATVVRRALAARTRDHHLIEDLTQETLIRLASSEQRLDAGAQRAYAIATARNLLTSHARHLSVRRRHVHRLVEDSSLDGPEQRTLQREETDALAVALERIDPDDRDLLLRHESEGVDLPTLARHANVSTGAIAMRLTRARAALRLEFLLAFRRIELPTARCRPVLLALATGDRRRQAALNAADHVESCPTCAALAKPVTERNRRIAGWLFVPLAESIRRSWRRLRGRPLYVAAAVLAAVTLVRHEAPNALQPSSTTVAEPPVTTAIGVPPSAVAPTPVTTVAPTTTVTPTPVTTVAPTTTVTPTPATTLPAVEAITASTAPCALPTLADQLDPATDLVCPIASTVVGVIGTITAPTIPATPPAPSGALAPVDSVLDAVPGP